MHISMILFTYATLILSNAMPVCPTMADVEDEGNSMGRFVFERLSGGDPISLSDFDGQVVMVVNTASNCGLTNQYEGLEQLYQTYKDQGLEVVAFGADWDEPYSCTDWVFTFDVTYPIADFETGMPNWHQEEIPYTLNMPNLGWGLPYNIIIDHRMQIIWGGVIDIAEEDNMAEAIEVLEGALEQLQPFLVDDDQDGTANQCDNCIDSHLYVTGNFDFSEEFFIDGLDYGYYPTIDVFDVLLLADLVANGEEITPCFIEASDFTSDNTLDIIDVFALAQYVIQGN